MYKDVLVEIADWWGSSPITGNEEWVRKMDGSTLHFILAQKLINYTGKLQFLIGTLSTAWIHHSRSMICVCVCVWMDDDIKTEKDVGLQTGNGTRNPLWVWWFLKEENIRKLNTVQTYSRHCHNSLLTEWVWWLRGRFCVRTVFQSTDLYLSVSHYLSQSSLSPHPSSWLRIDLRLICDIGVCSAVITVSRTNAIAVLQSEHTAW